MTQRKKKKKKKDIIIYRHYTDIDYAPSSKIYRREQEGIEDIVCNINHTNTRGSN